MSASDHEFQLAYDFVTDQREFTLHSADARVMVDEQTYGGQGRAVLRVSPEPQILLKASLRDLPSSIVRQSIIAGSPEVTSFEFGGKDIPGFSAGLGGEEGNEAGTQAPSR